MDSVVRHARFFISLQVFYSALLEFRSISYIEITVIIYDVLAEFSTL